MANIDLGNLTRYDGKIKQYAEDKYLSKNTANWQMTNKAGAVTCYPVPDTELEPIVDFMFTETPPLDGNKSPNNPSTIVGVDNINISKCGKNLIQLSSTTTTVRGITFTVDSNTGTVIANGTNDGTGTSNINLAFSIRLQNNCIYFLSGCPSGGSVNTYSLALSRNSLNGTYISTFRDVGNGKVCSMTATELCNCYITIYSGVTVSNLVFKPQLELGSDATFFELGQMNNYTYQLGNTYYGGSVNLATGEMTVTHKGIILNGTENWVLDTALTNTTRFYYSAITPAAYNSLQACSHFNYDVNFNKDVQHFYVSSGGRIYLFYPDTAITLNDFKTWLASQYTNSTPVTMVYELVNPYIVQIDPVQIKSLTALDKNTPRLNTLYTDADSIQVGYQKHPARTAYELENAILALEGGE